MLHRNELAGAAARALARAPRRPGRRAHLLHGGADRRTRSTAASRSRKDLYDLFGLEPHAELSTRPEQRLGTDEEWDDAEGTLRGGARAARARVRDRRGRGHVLRAEDRPPHDRRARALVADGDDPARPQMPKRFGLTYMGADNAEHTPVRHPPGAVRLASSASSASSSSTTAAPFRSGWRRSRCGSCPVGEGHREAAERAAATLVEAGYRVEVDERDETVGKRIRDAELEKIPFSDRLGRPASPTSRSPCASAAASSRLRASKSSSQLEKLALARRLARYSRACQAGADPFLTSRATAPRRFNRVERSRVGPLLAAALSFDEGGLASLVTSL